MKLHLHRKLPGLALAAGILATLFLAAAPARAAEPQRPDYSALLSEMDAQGSALHADSGVRLIKSDYSIADASGKMRKVEAISFMPAGQGPWPALLLIPGYSTSARDWADKGITFAAAGYFCLAVSQPGMGASDGPADFVGPQTIDTLSFALEMLRMDPRVDPQRLGVVGYSRGAMAASLLATREPDLKAVVCGGGIYDFAAAYAQSSSQMIRANMLAESSGAGSTELDPQAARVRSSLPDMDKLHARLLILHGEADQNAPPQQAYALRDELLRLGKTQAQSMDDFPQADFLLLTFPDTGHSIGKQNFQGNTIEFLKRVL